MEGIERSVLFLCLWVCVEWVERDREGCAVRWEKRRREGGRVGEEWRG